MGRITETTLSPRTPQNDVDYNSKSLKRLRELRTAGKKASERMYRADERRHRREALFKRHGIEFDERYVWN